MDADITGKIIRNGRKMKGLSQEALGKLVKLSTMSIRRYESGERIIPDDKLNAIIDVLGDSFFNSLNQYIDEAPLRVAHKLKELESQRNQEDEIFRRKVIDEAADDIKSFVDSENGIQIILSYFELNPTGQDEAVKRVMELTNIPEYQNKKESE